MRILVRRLAFVGALAGIAVALIPRAAAASARSLVGSYTLARRVVKDGTTLTGPEVVGFMTFTKTRRTVIMRWASSDGTPVSIAFIAAYTLSGEKYCESVIYGVQSNLGAPGVSYDAATETPTCTAAISDASGLSFDIPNERLRLRVVANEIIATTPRYTDHWAKAK